MIPFRIGLQQRVLPAYRVPFFDALARVCEKGFALFSGEPQSGEALGEPGQLSIGQHVKGKNVSIGRGRLQFYFQRGLTGWLEAWDPEVLVVEANPRNLSNRAAVRWAKNHHRPVIGWGLGAPSGQGRLRRLLAGTRNNYLCGFDALISYSQSGADQFAAAGFPCDRIFIAPNAVTPRPEKRPGKRSLVFRDGRPSILFVGRLQARKRVDALLRACATLPPQLQPLVTIIGDGPERDALQAVAWQFYPQAIFPGTKTGADLEPYYADADLFVLPGTGGLAIQQAMSHGLPVLVGEADGTQSDLVRADNGWIIPTGDDTTLARCLEQALSDPARLRRMGAESFRIVDEEINIERMVAVFEEAIHHAARRLL